MKIKQGISLIVLVITIIVMIILAATIIISLNNTGIIGAAENAVCKTNIKQAQNLAILTWANVYTKPDEYTLENIEQKLKEEFEKNGLKYEDYNVEVTKRGIDVSSKSGCVDSSGVEDESGNIETDPFVRYLMGSNGTGRKIMGVNENGENIGIFGQTGFIDDPLTEDIDETKDLNIEMLFGERKCTEKIKKYYLYLKYNQKAYKLTVSMSNDLMPDTSEKLEVIYEPKGREGQKTADGWTILYDNGKTVEAVSPTVRNELIIRNSNFTLTEVINAYNNAITTINDYCKNLSGLPENIGVRSVGAAKETTTTKYKSNNLAIINSSLNGVMLEGDDNYEQDMVRMTYHGVASASDGYFLASRYVEDISGEEVSFWIRTVDKTGMIQAILVQKASVFDTTLATREAVRPIITIENP